METDNIERIIDNKSEDSNQDQNEDEKSINNEEESEKAKEEIPKNKEIIQKYEKYQENKEEKENENPNLNTQDSQNPEIIDPFSTTTYTLKYKRSKEELKEIAVETNLPKSENCLFMINLKIVKNEDLTDNQNIQNENKDEVAPLRRETSWLNASMK